MSAFPDEPLDEIVVKGSDLAIASIVRSGAEAVTLLWSSEVTSTYTIQRSQPPSLWRLANLGDRHPRSSYGNEPHSFWAQRKCLLSPYGDAMIST
jgi:hypothetical protein